MRVFEFRGKGLYGDIMGGMVYIYIYIIIYIYIYIYLSMYDD